MTTMYHRSKTLLTLAALAWAALFLLADAAEPGPPLPDPDGRPADMSKPVQVYILMGQSNMLGFGKINGGNGSLTHAVKEKDKYPYLVDDAGDWTVRKDVRNVRVMGSGLGGMKVYNNEWMTIKGRAVGPEIGIGHHVGNVTDAPVLILKSCIGNRSLGWDLLPPGSERFEQDGMIYAGYKDSSDKWKKGETPKTGGWYAGMQYDGDTANAKNVLSELDRYYPGAKQYEVAGFFWWQGDKDRYNAVHASRYELNLVRLIEQLRKDFNAPRAKFVCATLGQTSKDAGGNEGKILQAQLAVDGKTGKYPRFKGNVASVYSKPFCHGGSSNGHYSGNAETYMDIGEAMGRAMAGLIRSDNSLSRLTGHLDASSRPVYNALQKKRYLSAHKALKKFKAAHEAKVKGGKLDKETLAAQKKLLEAFRREIDWPVGQAIAEIEELEKSGDVYRLSIIYQGHDKAFKGIDTFDQAVGAIGKALKGSRMRSSITAGKKFHGFIEKVRLWGAKQKSPRSPADIKSITTYLNSFAKREKDNIYGRAALLAAEKIADPDHKVNAAPYYIRLARAAE